MNKDKELIQVNDTERTLERLDRRLRMRKAVFVSFFAVLLACLILYAARIENKITELSERPAIVVYKDAITDLTANDSLDMNTESEPSEDASVTTEFADNNTINSATENNIEDIISDVGEEITETSENVAVIYYVTATGTKYHRSECSHLSKTKIEMTYDEIIKNGYKPCSRCIS